MEINVFKINKLDVGEYILKKNVDVDSNKFDLYFKTEQRVSDSEIEKIKKHFEDRIDIILYIEIYPKFRNKGFGLKMIEQIKSETSNDLVLVAETKTDALVKWYEKLGFNIIGYSHELPIMILKR
jgi:GNAT superfamily N-acetyltransferase